MASLLIAITARLDRIEAKLDRDRTKPPKEVLTVHDCVPLTGRESRTAQYDWFRRHRKKT